VKTSFGVRLLAVLLIATPLAGSFAAVFTVTNPNDDGPGSLRQAIRDANATAGPHTITFATADRIELRSALPVLACDVTIAGVGGRPTVTGFANGSVPVGRLFESAPGHTITISGLVLQDGSDPTGGSAILNRGSRITLRNILFWSNAGLAVKNTAELGQVATMEVENSTFFIFHPGAGAIDNSGAGSETLFVTNAMFTGGFISRSDVVLHNSDFASVTNCTLDLKRSQRGFGSGIHNDGPEAVLVLRNSTLVGSSADSETVLLYNSGGTGNFANNIFRVSGRVTSIGHVAGPGSQFASAGHNISSDSAGGDGTASPGGLLNAAGDIRNTDPLLDSSLYNNGGPTETFALLEGSPAINNADPGEAPLRDQRNYIRADAADIGAYERRAMIPAALANISTRAAVGTGDDVLIAGFIGSTSRSPDRVLVRAIGPSLPVPSALQDPQLEVHDGDSETPIENDNWQDAPNKEAIIDTEIAPSHPAESAVLAPFATTTSIGSYRVTAQVRGAQNSTGIALVEVYDLDRASAPKFLNLSTRGLVQTGNNVMIAGFIVLGPDSLRVGVRARGPSLRFSNVGNVLEDPNFAVFDQNGLVVAANDNWRAGAQQTELYMNGVSPYDDREAAAIAVFAPGAYTAVVRGVNDTTGVAIVELYRLEDE
jgi:hypothetical protein